MADLTCPCKSHMFVDITDRPITDKCTIQYRNKAFSDNYDYLTAELNTLYSNMAYTGFSDSVLNLNDYYAMIDLALLYATMRDNSSKINVWSDFVEYYDLDETISQLKCKGFSIDKIIEDIETCTPKLN